MVWLSPFFSDVNWDSFCLLEDGDRQLFIFLNGGNAASLFEVVDGNRNSRLLLLDGNLASSWLLEESGLFPFSVVGGNLNMSFLFNAGFEASLFSLTLHALLFLA